MRVFLTCIIATLLLAPVATASAPRSQSYIAPTNPFVSVSSTTAVGNIGGATFPANNEVPYRIEVVDASGQQVHFSACQDTSGDGICDENEPSAAGCGSLSLFGFTSTNSVVVFVDVIANPLTDPECTGVATTGIVTLYTR